jgi:hypothetical protein
MVQAREEANQQKGGKEHVYLHGYELFFGTW